MVLAAEGLSREDGMAKAQAIRATIYWDESDGDKGWSIRTRYEDGDDAYGIYGDLTPESALPDVLAAAGNLVPEAARDVSAWTRGQSSDIYWTWHA